MALSLSLRRVVMGYEKGQNFLAPATTTCVITNIKLCYISLLGYINIKSDTAVSCWSVISFLFITLRHGSLSSARTNAQ